MYLDMVAQLLLVTNPAYPRMRRGREFAGWRDHLARLGESEGLGPLREVIRSAIDGGLLELAPIREALQHAARTASEDTFLRAAEVSDRTAGEAPHAAFVLAWLALWGWRYSCDKRLYDDRGFPGRPRPGWLTIPLVAAEISLKLKSLYGAKLLVEHCHEVLQVAARRSAWSDPAVQAAIDRCRLLGRRIHTKYELAIGNLADDLRDYCVPGRDDLRAEMGAIIWSLGLVPECRAFLAGQDPPSSHFLRRIVRESLRCIPHDGLIQYVWLELKNRPSFNLRDHEVISTIVNHDWAQWMLDDQHGDLGLPDPPSRMYAQTLIQLLRGTIDEREAAPYLGMYDLLGKPPYSPHWLAWQRLHLLRLWLGAKFGYFAPQDSAEKAAEYAAYLEQQVDSARKRREASEKQPDLPEIGCRLSSLTFELIERCLTDDLTLPWPDPARWTKVIESLEQFRAGALSFWLRVNPPLPPAGNNGALDRLLDAEQESIEHLRGAYFLALRPTLPHHYNWSDLDPADFVALRDPRYRQWFWSPDTGRKEWKQIEKELATIAADLTAAAPEYGDRRLHPAADRARLTEALNQHTHLTRPSK